MSDPIQTVARSKLTKLVNGGQWGQRELARAVGTAQPTVRSWIEGTARPGPHLRTCVYLVAGIPEAEWETDEEREHVDRVRAQLGAATMPPPAPSPARRATSTRAKTAKTTTRARKRAA